MLDTIKVAIPLTKGQHKRIHQLATGDDSWVWALMHQQSGETVVRKFRGLAQTDGESYHREIRFDYPPRWSEDARLWVEFSLPKFWYGHNIILLYDWANALRRFRALLVEQFHLKRLKLAPIELWEVWRADCCYAYKFPSQQLAQLYLDSLKRMRFPRKQPAIHPHSIFWGGGTYAFKVYLKFPEFQAHDRKELCKKESNPDWIDHLDELASGVFRVEASLRRKYLMRMGVKTVSDLMTDKAWMEFDEHLEKNKDFDPLLSIMAISLYEMKESGNTDYDLIKGNTPLVSGRYYHAPDTILDSDFVNYYHPAGGFTYYNMPLPLAKLRELLYRFLGGKQGMETIDKVEVALSAHYKPVKVARLVGFWLYVKQFGAEKAKQCFGEQPYYYNRRQLKAAGVGLVEANENIIKADPEFFRNFGLDIPSPYAHHKADEFRDSGNVLNLDSYRAG